MAWLVPGWAQEFSASARLVGAESHATVIGQDVELSLSLTQAVPFRIFTLTQPNRLVLDFREVDWGGLDPTRFAAIDLIKSVQAGRFQENWSRMVVVLSEPYAIAEGGMITDDTEGTAVVRVRLSEVSEATFEASSGTPEAAIWGEPERAETEEPITRQTGDRPLVVVIDPGHGGIDPGAESGEFKEADLMLEFARALKEELLRAGNFEVVLTRESDTFVSLDGRVSIARASRADLFLSLHADALSEGQATGATVYTLSEEASDAAALGLAERHDRGDLLAGVDLSSHDDVVANVLMDLARTETEPRSIRLAQSVVEAIRDAGGRVHKRPHQFAGFSVLKAPDIPSVLIELGFLSSERDLANLRNETWRAATAAAIRAGIQIWAIEDATEALLLRQ